jgi:hypothetical protein
VYHLLRFGLTPDLLKGTVMAYLPEKEDELFRKNFAVIERDPLVVAAVAALAHVHNEISWGILPSGCAPELWATYGAQIAAAVSGNYNNLSAYRQTLATASYPAEKNGFLRLVAHALALGFSGKWPDHSANL